MARHKFPPRGYNQMEYPLPHNFEYQFGLSPYATFNSTITTLIRHSEDTNPADTVEVNPSHAAFAEETGTVILPDSIIPKINLHMSAQMNQVMAETDQIKFIKFNWMPIYMAFSDMYEAEDNVTDVNVESILELVHQANFKDATPLFNNLKCKREENHPMSTINQTETFADMNLDTDIKMECVTFDEQLMWDTLSYFSNGPMLAKAMGQWHTEYLRFDRPWTFNSSNFTHPTVKRGNEFTYCGILFHVPIVGTAQQFHQAADVTVSTSLIEFDIQCRYDEWNNQFDQTSV